MKYLVIEEEDHELIQLEYPRLGDHAKKKEGNLNDKGICISNDNKHGLGQCKCQRECNF